MNAREEFPGQAKALAKALEEFRVGMDERCAHCFKPLNGGQAVWVPLTDISNRHDPVGDLVSKRLLIEILRAEGLSEFSVEQLNELICGIYGNINPIVFCDMARRWSKSVKRPFCRTSNGDEESSECLQEWLRSYEETWKTPSEDTEDLPPAPPGFPSLAVRAMEDEVMDAVRNAVSAAEIAEKKIVTALEEKSRNIMLEERAEAVVRENKLKRAGIIRLAVDVALDKVRAISARHGR